MVHFDISEPPGGANDSPVIGFLHAAVGDRRMWHPQWNHFSPTHRLIAVDSRGFGQHPPSREPFSRAQDVIDLLDEHDVEHAVLVGGSMGGRVAMEIAAQEPARVTGLMLLAAALPSHDWSPEVQALWRLESDALDRGDIDEAVRVNLEFWVDGPRRERARLTAADRTLVAEMQDQAFRHELAMPNAAAETRRGDLDAEFKKIAARTVVVYGQEDPDDLAVIAGKIAASIPHTSLHPIADAAHLPSMESPAEVNQLLEQLLADIAYRTE